MTEAAEALATPSTAFAPVEPPERLLMGPGPSNPHPAVLRAAAIQRIWRFLARRLKCCARSTARATP
jgi:aspartate aminotransferase-like enzyme